MAKFQIPRGYLVGFDSIINISDSEFSKVLDFVRDVPIGISSKTFFYKFTSGFNFKGVDDVAATIYSLPSLLAIEDEATTTKEISEEIAESFGEIKEINGAAVSSNDLNVLSTRLQDLFKNFDNLISTHKTISVLVSNDKIYKESRVFSDVRLILNEDIEANKRNAVIIHKLKIGYKNNDTEKEIYLSLDHSDLKELKSHIDRALEKDRIIRQDYNQVVTFIDIN